MKLTKLLFVLTIFLYLFGCASGAKIENMVFQENQKTYPDGLHKNMEVTKVSGGEKTNPLWTSEISNEAFLGALKESLLSQGLYSADGKLRLEVKMIKVDQPLFGLDFKVITHVRYILTNRIDNSVILERV
ncbi:MAG: hypothetical protein KJO08_05000 [Gammaproteobacteria bacterium]|nr:hypothetical protein [Gammaproteobacteria bacterium]NNJ85145.1 hypothetical protein [Gammaproteobacteria bacterium]